MLRELGLAASVAYLSDRDERWFSGLAHYWQFDRSAVALLAGDGYIYYCPGELGLAPGLIPWFSEASTAYLIHEEDGHAFVDTYYTRAQSNRIDRLHTLTAKGDFKISGKVQEVRTGHAARDLRLLGDPFTGLSSEELLDLVSEGYANAEIFNPSMSDTGGTSPVSIEFEINYDLEVQRAGSRAIVKPMRLLGSLENPFSSADRRYWIFFDYANVQVETLALALPDEWQVESVPEDTSFQNEAGQCAFTISASGGALSVQRLFAIERPVLPASEYHAVKELFEKAAAIQENSVVLRTSRQ
jgi:hypothetical protein